MTSAAEAVREGSLLADPQTPDSNAESRACARESLALPSPPSPGAVTGRVRRAGQVASRAVAVLDKPGTLIHSQPPTFRQAWDRHLECARHYEALALRWPRLWWGWAHLFIVKPALNLAEWVTESPARSAVAAVLTVVIWVFA